MQLGMIGLGRMGGNMAKRIAAALYARQTSRGGADDILRVVSTMRAQFGGHVTKIDEIATH